VVPPSLAELRARPDDRELLLVYADWLQSQGHPRGELIAVQDAEQHCESVDEFEQARARAIELVESSAELRPELPQIDASGGRNLWALWRGGFIRRLELLIDRPAPRPGAGLRGWSELIASALAHPSLALLEELLIRVDLRGEPVDETEAALAIVIDGVVASSDASFTLALWTSRPPRAELRDRFHQALPGIRKLWYSTDITRILPPKDSPIVAVEQAIGVESDYDFVWVDVRGNFREQFVYADPSLAVHVRHIAERRREPLLTRADRVPQRRIAGLVEQLAARFEVFSVAQPLAPREMASRPEPIALATACEWLGDDGSLASALAGFSELDWWWFANGCGRQAWLGLCGLGAEQLLMIAMLMAAGSTTG
jgi:uncharacterized protein (TIGR02996 family)